MNVNFENFSKDSVFQIGLTKTFSKEKDVTFIYSVTHGYNPKSKAAHKGLVFTDKFTAEEVVSRLYHSVIAKWPESKDTLKKIMDLPN